MNELYKILLDVEKNFTSADTAEAIILDMVANQSKWISVEDKLPEHDNNVLAILNGNMEIMAYCNIHEDGETFKVWHIVYDGLQGDPIYDDNYEPTHWQPLPKRN